MITGSKNQNQKAMSNKSNIINSSSTQQTAQSSSSSGYQNMNLGFGLQMAQQFSSQMSSYGSNQQQMANTQNNRVGSVWSSTNQGDSMLNDWLFTNTTREAVYQPQQQNRGQPINFQQNNQYQHKPRRSFFQSKHDKSQNFTSQLSSTSFTIPAVQGNQQLDMYSQNMYNAANYQILSPLDNFSQIENIQSYQDSKREAFTNQQVNQASIFVPSTNIKKTSFVNSTQSHKQSNQFQPQSQAQKFQAGSITNQKENQSNLIKESMQQNHNVSYEISHHQYQGLTMQNQKNNYNTYPNYSNSSSTQKYVFSAKPKVTTQTLNTVKDVHSDINIQSSKLAVQFVTNQQTSIQQTFNPVTNTSESLNAPSTQAAINPNARKKYETCKNFKEKGFCKYGDKCLFAHGEHELSRRQPIVIQTQEAKVEEEIKIESKSETLPVEIPKIEIFLEQVKSQIIEEVKEVPQSPIKRVQEMLPILKTPSTKKTSKKQSKVLPFYIYDLLGVSGQKSNSKKQTQNLRKRLQIFEEITIKGSTQKKKVCDPMFITESTEGDDDCGGDFSENWRNMCQEDDSENKFSPAKKLDIENEDISINLNSIFTSCLSKTTLLSNDDEIKTQQIQNHKQDKNYNQNQMDENCNEFSIFSFDFIQESYGDNFDKLSQLKIQNHAKYEGIALFSETLYGRNNHDIWAQVDQINN
eukprot:403376801